MEARLGPGGRAVLRLTGAILQQHSRRNNGSWMKEGEGRTVDEEEKKKKRHVKINTVRE